jgi:hypothetical protein
VWQKRASNLLGVVSALYSFLPPELLPPATASTPKVTRSGTKATTLGRNVLDWMSPRMLRLLLWTKSGHIPPGSAKPISVPRPYGPYLCAHPVVVSPCAGYKKRTQCNQSQHEGALVRTHIPVMTSLLFDCLPATSRSSPVFPSHSCRKYHIHAPAGRIIKRIVRLLPVW